MELGLFHHEGRAAEGATLRHMLIVDRGCCAALLTGDGVECRGVSTLLGYEPIGASR